MKITSDGKLQGFAREVYGDKEDNALTGVFTLERQGNVKSDFRRRFEMIKSAATNKQSAEKEEKRL